MVCVWEVWEWVWVCGVLEVPMDQWGVSIGRVTPAATGWASSWSSDMVTKIHVLLTHLFQALAAILPAAHHPSVV